MRRLLMVVAIASRLVIAVTPVRAFDFAACTSAPNSSDHPTWHVYRNSFLYLQAIGQIVIRDVVGCTNPVGGEDSFSAIFPANMQDSDCNPFTQIGYGSVNASIDTFWASVDGDSIGCGDVSSMSLGFGPAIGHLDRFEIFPYYSGQSWWEMRVTDVTINNYGYRLVPRNDSSTTEVWYGIETHNYHDQFGGNSSTNIARLQYLGYKYSGGPTAYTYLTGTGQAAWANAPVGNIPLCWVESISTITTDLYTSLNGYTGDC